MTDEDKIKLLYPRFGEQVVDFLHKTKNEGLIGGIFCGLRTYAESDALYAQGRTKPGKIVTNAKAGQSYHNFGLACFDKETEVLTDSGFKYFNNLSSEDKVMSFKGDKLFYEYPIGYIKYLYSGEMVKIKTRSVDILVTPNHRMIGKRKTTAKWSENYTKIDADKIDCKWKIPTAGEYIETHNIEYPFKNGIEYRKKRGKLETYKISPELWWEFMGWYLAEGYCCGVDSGKRRKHTGRDNVSISQSDDSRHFNKIEELLSKMPFKFGRYGHEFKISCKALWEVLFPLGTSYTKRIPRYLLNASKPLLEKLFWAMVYGDGHVLSKNIINYYTVNKLLADDFCELAVKLGYSVRVDERVRGKGSFIKPTGQRVSSDLPQYCVCARSRKDHELRDGNGRKRITRQFYNDFVFCVKTNAGGLLLRRSGEVFICGNCDFVLKDKNGNWTWNGDFSLLGKIAKECKLEWGGLWKSFPDLPHIQNSYGEGDIPKKLDYIYRQNMAGGAPLHSVWSYLDSKK